MDDSTVPYVGRNYCDLPNELRDHIIGFMDANDRIAMKFVSKLEKCLVEKRRKTSIFHIFADSDEGLYKIKYTEDSPFVRMTKDRFTEVVRKVDEFGSIAAGRLEPSHNIFVYEPSARCYFRKITKLYLSCGGAGAYHCLKIAKPSTLQKVTIQDQPIIAGREHDREYRAKSRREITKLISTKQVQAVNDLVLNCFSMTDALFTSLRSERICFYGKSRCSAQALNQLVKDRLSEINNRGLQLFVATNGYLDNLDVLSKGLNFRRFRASPTECHIIIDTPYPDIKVDIWVTSHSTSIMKAMKT